MRSHKGRLDRLEDRLGLGLEREVWIAYGATAEAERFPWSLYLTAPYDPAWPDREPKDVLEDWQREMIRPDDHLVILGGAPSGRATGRCFP